MGILAGGASAPAGPSLSAWQHVSTGHSAAMRAVLAVNDGTDEVVFAGGVGGRYAISRNGGAFSSGALSGSSDNINGAAYGEDSLILVTEGAYAVRFSGWPPNDQTMEQLSSYPLNAIEYVSGQGFRAVGGNGVGRKRASFGFSWDDVNYAGNTDLFCVVTTPTTTIAVGATGSVLSTTRGMSTWSYRASGSTSNLLGVAVGNNLVVAVGASGTVSVSSNNGTNWTKSNVTGLPTLRGVVFGSGIFMAVGDSNTAYVSSDGVTWFAHDGLRDAVNYAVAHRNGAFYAAGSGGYISKSTVL